jgi:N-acylneuraminate cytidylyltransferase
MTTGCVALVPLRGGSKGIPGKNIRLFNGKPLCCWVLEAALSARNVDAVYVSTDSIEIANVVRSNLSGVKIIERPAHLADDQSSTESVMLHFMTLVPFHTLLLMQATSPLTRGSDIESALEKMELDNLDSLLTGVRQKRFLWGSDGVPTNYDPMKRPRRQEFDGHLVENGAFYITRREILDKYGNRLGGRIGVFEMPEDTYEELDEPADWPVAELRMRMRNSVDVR